MSEQAGTNFSQMLAQMGAGAGGMGGQGVGSLKTLCGINFDGDSFLVNFQDNKDLHLSGFEAAFGESGQGLLPQLFKMRGEGFFGKILHELFANLNESIEHTQSMNHMFNAGNDMMGGHGASMPHGMMSSSSSSGSSGGGGENYQGAHRPFTALPNVGMNTVGPISNVPMSQLGSLIPSPTPGMGQTRQVER